MTDPKNHPDNFQMSLTEHLGELRTRLVYSVYGLAVATIICWIFHDQIFEVIRSPIVPYLEYTQGKLVFLKPIDGFMVMLKVACLAGLVLSSPVWLFQVWKFVAPALHEKEKKYGIMFFYTAVALFAAGVAFSYFLVLPMAFKFLLFVAKDKTIALIDLDQYLSFFMTTVLIFGLAFEMPLVLTILGILGIIDQKFLRDKRRYAIVALAVLSAIITPPDAMSMILMLVPMIFLYEVSIIAVGVMGRRGRAANV